MIQETETADISSFIEKWSKKRGNLIMVLHEIQNAYGYVSRSVALELARQMGVPLARIYEVLTFYHYFKLRPPGKYVISICMGTACYLKGASDLVREFEQQLGVEEGETTEDGMFHLQSVRCLGCCNLAPVAMIKGRIYSRVHCDDVRRILAGYVRSEEAV
ncbi:NAD(P)H-dependent oxidoreductase subunit E [Candidatus Sumerlaeota bacterium]